MEDATNLAVQAANGMLHCFGLCSVRELVITDAQLHWVMDSEEEARPNLAKSAKHRMREQATQKLSHAYNLDEIAASVATMQATSTLEDVAKLVLQRDQAIVDAKYVHFFHEKIPSRSMADYTTLQPLDEVISQRPTDGALYRTRAVTRMFKDDFVGAARDLTEALGICRLYNAQHQETNAQADLVTARDAAAMMKEYRADRKIEEKDQPSSLESQLLFHRANVYSTLAC